MFGLSSWFMSRRNNDICGFAYHSPHSLTWSWVIRLSRGAAVVKPFARATREYQSRKLTGIGAGLGGLLGFNAYRNNGGLQWTVSVAFLHVSMARQRPMWFRDMYQRLRDEEDQRKGMLWVRDDHPHKVWAEGERPAQTH